MPTACGPAMGERAKSQGRHAFPTAARPLLIALHEPRLRADLPGSRVMGVPRRKRYPPGSSACQQHTEVCESNKQRHGLPPATASSRDGAGLLTSSNKNKSKRAKYYSERGKPASQEFFLLALKLRGGEKVNSKNFNNTNWIWLAFQVESNRCQFKRNRM